MKFYKRLSLLLTSGIMGIGLISYSFLPGTQAGADNIPTQVPTASTVTAAPTPTEVPKATPTPAPTPTPVPNDLESNVDKAIVKLVSDYLDAKLTCSKDAFKDIVTDVSYIDEEALQTHLGTVLSFDGLTCYTKRGAGIIDYVVYYTYYSNIATVATPAISIDRVLVTTDAAGNYRIFQGSLDDDIQAELNAHDFDHDVVALNEATLAELEKEMTSDEDLYAYMVRMINEIVDGGLPAAGSDPDE